MYVSDDIYINDVYPKEDMPEAVKDFYWTSRGLDVPSLDDNDIQQIEKYQNSERNLTSAQWGLIAKGYEMVKENRFPEEGLSVLAKGLYVDYFTLTKAYFDMLDFKKPVSEIESWILEDNVRNEPHLLKKEKDVHKYNREVEKFMKQAPAGITSVNQYNIYSYSCHDPIKNCFETEQIDSLTECTFRSGRKAYIFGFYDNSDEFFGRVLMYNTDGDPEFDDSDIHNVNNDIGKISDEDYTQLYRFLEYRKSKFNCHIVDIIDSHDSNDANRAYFVLDDKKVCGLGSYDYNSYNEEIPLAQVLQEDIAGINGAKFEERSFDIKPYYSADYWNGNNEKSKYGDAMRPEITVHSDNEKYDSKAMKEYEANHDSAIKYLDDIICNEPSYDADWTKNIDNEYEEMITHIEASGILKDIDRDIDHFRSELNETGFAMYKSASLQNYNNVMIVALPNEESGGTDVLWLSQETLFAYDPDTIDPDTYGPEIGGSKNSYDSKENAMKDVENEIRLDYVRTYGMPKEICNMNDKVKISQDIHNKTEDKIKSKRDLAESVLHIEDEQAEEKTKSPAD